MAAVALRPLNANDLFWHLASGREILASRSIPRTDPFSFAGDGGPWLDHEWLWQVAAQGVYATASEGRGPAPDAKGGYGLILFGLLTVLAAFGIALWALAREDLPAGGVAALGLVAAEVARERMMVRPETASLLFLAIFLFLLGRGEPGLRRGVRLALVAAVWANVHPAALLAPVLVLLHGLGSDGRDPVVEGPLRRGKGILLETLLAGLGTLVNPFGAALWTVPFKLSTLVRTQAFFNPEWLRPPLARFPLFYVALAIVAAAVVLLAVRGRRIPPGALLIALLLGAIGAQQMRHMGLFSIALLFAGKEILNALLGHGRSRARELLGGAPLAVSVSACALLAGGLALAAPWGGPSSVQAPAGAVLDPGRFPVAACEAIAKNGPGLRLYNDVQFGGYLIWRFYPPQKVFIDGRNEVYARLLARLGRIHTEDAYADWRLLVGQYGIEGAIVKYKEGKKGVLYPPERPGSPPVRGYRAWSAFLFPAPEWALVWFDDTALVFMKRGGRGESWIARGEYRDYNPEDRDYLLDRARGDPALAARLRSEAQERIANRSMPPCSRAESFLQDLLSVARPGMPGAPPSN